MSETDAQKIAQLKALISETHKHGEQIQLEIQKLQAAHAPALKIDLKKAHLKGLEVLNARRERELKELEHPAPKPPAPKPAPAPKPKPKPKPKPAPRFTMFDSTNVGNIPAEANSPNFAVAGYVNGLFENFDEVVKRFPKAKHLSISINASTDAQALDVENGDATPGEAPGWVRKQHARGEKTPWIYCNTSTLPQVLQALTDNGIKRDEYRIWTAHYTNEPHIEEGSDATQYEDHEELYDISLLEPYLL